MPVEQSAVERPSEVGRSPVTCTRCVMDTSDPAITFDEAGVCNHCHTYDLNMAMIGPLAHRQRMLSSVVEDLRRRGRGRDYDCIVGISGGIDSAYTAYLLVRELGLRPLAVHVDLGWNSEVAVRNIERLVNRLKIDLFTHVVDWDEMRDLQAAFLRSSLANADAPQDHAFVAVLYDVARRQKIDCLFSGHNFATESCLPSSWGYNARDGRLLRDVHLRYGHGKLKHFPVLPFWKDVLLYNLLFRVTKINLLDYYDYEKDEAIRIIGSEIGWEYYGGKHYESRFTRFYQSYYLPKRFGFDKRRAHVSSLILSGEVTRDEALATLKEDLTTSLFVREETDYVLRKLGIPVAEFEEIVRSPVRTYRDFKNRERAYKIVIALNEWRKRRRFRPSGAVGFNATAVKEAND
jgi:N-acetyl sugar amidotransferase